MTHAKRNGCQPPFTVTQWMSWVGQPIILAWFAVVAFGFLSGAQLALTAALWSVFLSCALANWAYCQLVDPSKSATYPIETKIFNALVPWLANTTHETHYCSVCRKSVPGIDHHCKWLSTCVGKRTYQSFYLLTLFASLTYLWQLIALCLLVSPVWNDDEVKRRSNDVFHDGTSQIGFYVVCGVGIAITLPVASFYTLLFLFHSYLQWKGVTTYGWFIQRSENARKRKAAHRLRLQQQKLQHPQLVGSQQSASRAGGAAATLSKALFGSPTTSPIGSQVGSQTSQNDLLVPPPFSSSPPFVSMPPGKGSEGAAVTANNTITPAAAAAAASNNGHAVNHEEEESSDRDEEDGEARMGWMGSGSLPSSPVMGSSSGGNEKKTPRREVGEGDDLEMQLEVS